MSPRHLNLSIVLSIACSTFVTSASASSATHNWVRPSTDTQGCATGIAVGPNNVPYVTGCGPGPNNYIYYLAQQTNCSSLSCPQTWHYTNGAGIQVFVNLDGDPWALTSNGATYWVSDKTTNGTEVPADQWSEMTPSPYAGGCLSSLAVPLYGGTPYQDLVTGAAESSPATLLALWGIGCGTPGVDNAIWELPIQYNFVTRSTSGSTTWQQVDAQDNAAAVQITFFNDPSNNDQVPWVLTAEGTVYSYARGAFHQNPAPPGVYAITDHFVLAPVSNNQPSGALHWNGSTQTFDSTPWADPVAPSGYSIAQIAYSGPINGTAKGTIGPSFLWGIDTAGNIYYAAPKSGGSQ
jgi:hypothetical protein